MAILESVLVSETTKNQPKAGSSWNTASRIIAHRYLDENERQNLGTSMKLH
jgi:hypothetical protein